MNSGAAVYPEKVRRLSCSLLLLASATTLFSQQTPRSLSVPSAPGIEVTMEAEGAGGDDPGGRLQQIITAYESRLGPAAAGAPPATHSGAGGTFASVIRQFTRDRGLMHAFLTSPQTSAVCHLRVPVTQGSNKTALAAAMNACGAELKRSTSAAASTPVQPTPPPAPVAAAEPPKYQANWSLVEGVYFQVTYISGAGGMPLPDYEPVILFRDGTYYEIDEAALEDIDLAAEKQRRPKRWGKWRQSGGQYLLTRSSGRTETLQLQNGSFFQAFGGDAAGNRLTGRYKRVSGGGNSALGGDIMVAISSQFKFSPNGEFNGGSDVNGANSGASTGVSSVTGASKKSAGSYNIDRFTLTLHYASGRVERKFFAFGSQKSPARLDTDMIFIGSRTFVLD